MDSVILGVLDTQQGPDDVSDLVASMCRAVNPSCPELHQITVPGAGHLIFAKVCNTSNTAIIRGIAADEPAAAFAGAIYNRPSLLAEMGLGRGDPAASSADEWFVARIIERWGVADALAAISGGFALAYWDPRGPRLVLARDRSSAVDLYYGRIGTALVFASDFRAFKPFHCRMDINRNALSMLLRYGFCPEPHTLYRHVRKLPASHYALVAPDPSTVTDIREEGYADSLYRRYSDASLAHLNAADASDRFEALLSHSIRSRIGNTSVGAFMSSGFDSTLIAAMLQKITGTQVRTFTAGFQGEHFDEAPAARIIASHLGTRHHEIRISDSMLADAVQDIPKIYAEPLADSSQLPSIILARGAKAFVDSVFAGEGGDCLLGDYVVEMATCRALLRARSLPLPVRDGLRHGLLGAARLSPVACTLAASLLNACLKLTNSDRDVGSDIIGILQSRSLADAQLTLYSRVLDPSPFVLGEQNADTGLRYRCQQGNSTAKRIEELIQKNADVTLPPVIRKTISACDHVSLGVAMPFTDTELIKFCSGLPLRFRYRNSTSKWLLRQVAYRYIPRSLLDQPKRGFSVWLGPILRTELRDWAEHLLDAKRLASEGFFNHKRVRQEWGLHVKGLGDFREERLWSILMFQQWLDGFAAS